jgi:cell division protein FtsA
MNIGSSCVRAIAADWDERHNTFHILGCEYSNRHQSVEKGIPTNSSDVGFVLNETWKKLCNRVGRGELKNIFVCVGGRSLQSVHVEAHRQQRRSEIKQKLLNEMIRECSEKIEARTPAAGVLSVLPERWEVDEQYFDEAPIKQLGKDITLYATAFVMRKEYCTKMDDTIKRAGLAIFNREVIPDACITALTTDEERENGCAVIDMGAQTTTLTIFKDNQFQLTKVVPLGGYHVSHDIETLGISSINAEKLKCKWGTLSLKPEEVDKGLRVPAAREGEEPLIVTRGNLSSIIACRINEIIMPLLAEIEKTEGIQTIYLTGGGSMLRGIVPFLRKKTSIPVEYGSHAQWLAADTEDEFYQPLYGSLIGTLLLGQMYKDEHPDEEPQPKTVLGKLRKDLTDLFGGEDF